MKNTTRRVTGDWLLIGLFGLALVLPALDLALDLDPLRRDDNTTTLVIEPGLGGLARLPGNFKGWFDKSFGFRDTLLESHGRLKHDLLGVSPSNKVLFGSDGWLFLDNEGNLDSYRNLYAFPQPELDAWVARLHERDRLTRELGASYHFFVAPGKPTIYGDSHLPAHRAPISTSSRLDQLSAAIARELPELSYLDLRPTLKSRSRDRRLYYRTDTHWSPMGAFEAYLVLRDRLGQAFPEASLERWPTLDQVRSVTKPGGDLARMAGLKHVLPEDELLPVLADARPVWHSDGQPFQIEVLDAPRYDRVVTHCPDAELESAVVFHDSFGRVMVPLLAQTFRRTVFVWSDDFDPRLVAEERPDVVIQQIVERRLLRPRTPRNDEPAQSAERQAAVPDDAGERPISAERNAWPAAEARDSG